MTLKKTFATTVAAAGMALASLIAAPAVAQEAVAPAEVAEGELDAFVDALEAVMTIEQSYAGRLGEAEGDEAQQQAILEEAQAEMVAAVNATPDMDVDRYVEILELAQNDAELNAELSERLQN